MGRIITLNCPDKLNAFNDELTFSLQDALKDGERPGSAGDYHHRSGRDSAQDRSSKPQHQSGDGQRPSLGDSIRRRYNPIVIRSVVWKSLSSLLLTELQPGPVQASHLLVFPHRGSTVNFIQSFTKVGLVPDSAFAFSAAQTLIGVTKAFELMLSAEKFGAAEALNLGLVNKVVPADALVTEAMTLAEKLAQGRLKPLG